MFKKLTEEKPFNSTDEGDRQTLEQHQAPPFPGSSSALQRAASYLDWLCSQVRAGVIVKADLIRRARLSKEMVLGHLEPHRVSRRPVGLSQTG